MDAVSRGSALAATDAGLQRGRPWPMGATAEAGGVNFAVFSAHATQLELCLFDPAGRREEARLLLPSRSGDVWHGFLPGAAAGLVYGLRAHGPWRPDRGHRFNPHKLLLDPWAREIVGHFEWRDEHFGGDRAQLHHLDWRDNAAHALKARVTADDGFDWGDDQPPRHRDEDLVIYEAHVRGQTMRMPQLPAAERGSYLGLASAPAIAHLERLGITAVSLLPVHQRIDEERLVRHRLVNHWGYNTIGYFCPEPRYATQPDGATARREFRTMVRALHAAGIEVLLDVVYNHTAETDEHGPTISWRGLDNASWYRLPHDRRSHYENHAGTGNTLDIRQPRALQLVMDSLRYWVSEMHVDGFRFDLAPVLARGDHGYERDAPFFKALLQDPVLSRVRLIAEPWDIGPHGYQLGNFPSGWLEWNDRYRDTMRAFWLGGDTTRGEFAQRLAGSAALFQARRRAPAESVNYIVSHDGFTLADLVSYDVRHNQANLEDNRDGHGHNLSWNCGFEGPTDDPEVLALRARLQRALLATLLLSQGTPMLAAGAELGHTQRGNNNAYCQDNEIGWIDWDRADDDLIETTARLIALRERLRPLPNRWATGLPDALGRVDLAWLRRGGRSLSADDWGSRASRVIAADIGTPGGAASRLLLLFNAGDEDTGFALPGGPWRLEFDSAEPRGWRDWQGAGGTFALRSRSVVVLASGTGAA